MRESILPLSMNKCELQPSLPLYLSQRFVRYILRPAAGYLLIHGLESSAMVNYETILKSCFSELPCIYTGSPKIRTL